MKCSGPLCFYILPLSNLFEKYARVHAPFSFLSRLYIVEKFLYDYTTSYCCCIYGRARRHVLYSGQKKKELCAGNDVKIINNVQLAAGPMASAPAQSHADQGPC